MGGTILRNECRCAEGGVMADKWIIPAPVWGGDTLRIYSAQVGWVEETDGEWFAATDIGNEGAGHSTFRPTEFEARAWVNAEVMKAIGATPHSHDDKTA